uniref:Uncharacterized protein n=1 Tax=Desulfobacca acetoxidans TaxID=60893 RepID=A0A7C3SJC4_9BACT
MKTSRLRCLTGFLVTAAMIMASGGLGRAAYEDAAMFYEELSQYGNWVDYGNYGPVWHPTRVTENWRPYLDGRWVPTDSGWVFETTEPWGWATYHYGNWMPTEDYGWVWVPGSTWYPNTVAWRSSDEYIGWGPIPPPNYVPPPSFYPPGGYYPGMPILELITAPFWILVRAASFLLGFGLPYAPAYSYYNCGCLMPFDIYPLIIPRTFLLTDCFFLAYAPDAFFFFGPPFPFVSRVCAVPIVRIYNYVKEVKIVNIRHVTPPRFVLERRPYLRKTIPEAVLEGRRLEARRVEDVRRVRHPARPDVVQPPRDLPRIPRIERVTPELRPKPERAVPEGVRPAIPEKVTPRATERVRPEAVRPKVPARVPSERVRPEAPARRGLQLPPQAVPEEREMRKQLQRDRLLEQRQIPREQQRQFRRQEQELRRQEIFRAPTRPEAPRPRLERVPVKPRQSPEVGPERPTPSSGVSSPAVRPSRARP